MKTINTSRAVLMMAIFSFFMMPLEAKKLTSPQVGLLNLALSPLPQVTARLNLAKKHAQDACDLLKEKPHTLNKAAIDLLVQKMFAPVKEFFGEIIEHKGMVVPLVTESLASYPSVHKGKTLADVSHLLLFFNQTNKDIVNFFQQRMVSEQDFDQAVHEMKYFLDDLFDSFSPNVLQAYEKMIKDIQAKKGQKPATTAVALAA